MGLDDPSSTCINVSGTTFHVPNDLFTYLKSLPWTDENNAKNANNKNDKTAAMTMDADPTAFRWLLYYVKHESLPNSFWKKEEDVHKLQALAVLLGMSELVLYIGNHTSPKDGFLKSPNMLIKRSSSWHKRARAQSKRTLESLVRGPIRKLTSPSYEELVHQSQHVM